MIDFVISGKNVKFFNRTVFYASTWAWTFGDTNTSTAKEPSHTYSAFGTYTVTLTATCGTHTYTATKVIQLYNGKTRLESSFPLQEQTEGNLTNFQSDELYVEGTGPTAVTLTSQVNWSLSDVGGSPSLSWSYVRTHGGSPHTDGTGWIYYGPSSTGPWTGIFDTSHLSPVSGSGTTAIPSYSYWLTYGVRIIENTTQYERIDRTTALISPAWDDVLASVFNEFAFRVDSNDLRNLRFQLKISNVIPGASYETTINYYRRAVGEETWVFHDDEVVSFTAIAPTYDSDYIIVPNSDDGYETMVQGISTIRTG